MINYPNQFNYGFSQYPQYQQPIQPTIQPTVPSTMQTQQTPIVWVTTEDSVRNYPVAPGGSVLFMHENEPYMYMKSADQLGKANIIKKRLVDESETKDKPIDLTEYIKREEIENIIFDAVRNEVEKRMSEISFKPTKARKPVIVDEED